MKYRLVRGGVHGVHLWWQYLEPRIYTLSELAELVCFWEPVGEIKSWEIKSGKP